MKGCLMHQTGKKLKIPYSGDHHCLERRIQPGPEKSQKASMYTIHQTVVGWGEEKIDAVVQIRRCWSSLIEQFYEMERMTWHWPPTGYGFCWNEW